MERIKNSEFVIPISVRWRQGGRRDDSVNLIATIAAGPREAERQPGGLDSWTAVAVHIREHGLKMPIWVSALESNFIDRSAMGGRTTRAKRRQRLRQIGWFESALQEIHAPVRLLIGSKSPPDIAFSNPAENVLAGHGLPRS